MTAGPPLAGADPSACRGHEQDVDVYSHTPHAKMMPGNVPGGAGPQPDSTDQRYHPAMAAPLKLFGKLPDLYPEPEAGDRVIASAAALAGFVPYGETVTGFVNAWFGTPLEKRKKQWCKMLADVVQELCDRFQGFDPKKLTENEAFVSAVIETSRIAVSTHQAEKRAILRNALVKIGSGEGPDDDLQQVYFRIIDALTPLHVRILYLIWTGTSQMAQFSMEKTYGPLIQQQYPDLMRHRELLGHIIRNLTDFHLVQNMFPGRDFPEVPVSPQNMTNEGISFRRFVIAPEDLPR